MIKINNTDEQLLLLAAETIKLYCKGELCCDCIFNDFKNSVCPLKASVPAEWEVKSNDQDDQH